MLQKLFPEIYNFIEKEEYRLLMDIDLQKLSLRNEFVFIIKPECFLSCFDRKKNLLKIFEFIDGCFEKHKVNILGAVIFNGRYASSRSVIENEYYVLNRGARYGMMHLAANKREAITAKYEEYIPIGAYGFLNLKTGYTAASLEALTEVQLSDKIGNGTYVLPLEQDGKKYAILNAFHPRQIEHFNTTTHITMALLCNTNTNYKDLTENLTGFYSPQKARQGSVRRYLYDYQNDLGLTINNLYNGVHISPSPLEGILGFYRYSDTIKNNISKTYLGNLLSSEYEEYQIEEFMENPTVFFNGDNTDLFEICEQKNAHEIAQLVKGLRV